MILRLTAINDIKLMKMKCNPENISFRLLLISILVDFHLAIQSQVVNYSLVPDTKIDFQKLGKGFRLVPDVFKMRSFWFWHNRVATKQSIYEIWKR
jgi:hypothetical protein